MQEINIKHYLEIDSYYRDRNDYPEQSNFVINTSYTPENCFISPEKFIFWKGQNDENCIITEGNQNSIIITPANPNINIFRGQIIKNITINEDSVILNYDSFSKQLNIESSFSDNFNIGDIAIIENTSDNQHIFFGKKFYTLSNSFKDYIIYDSTINEYRNIIDYNYKYNILTLDNPFSRFME